VGPSQKATKAEKTRMDVIAQMYCPCCVSVGLHFTRIPPSEVHHLLQGNKRMGHWFTIPCCSGHHRGAWTPQQKQTMHPEELVSIADGRKAFENVYGTERSIWRKIQLDHGWDTEWSSSKILPRRKAA
jgi:hypothetical protein